MRRYNLVLILIVLSVVVVACGGGGDEDPEPAAQNPEPTAQEVADTSGDACPSIVAEALEVVDTSCQNTGRNQFCYGNLRLTADLTEDVGPFESPGDMVDVSAVQRLTLNPMDTGEREWGVVMLRAQADLESTVPGQLVTFLLMGDVSFENQGVGADGLQAFYFQSGIGDAQCDEAPDSGILVQTPEGVGAVEFRVNGVDVALGSTAYLQAQPSQELTVNVVEGQAEVTAQNVTRTVSEGTRTQITLDANNEAASPPTEPEPYEIDEVAALPMTSLDRPVNIARMVFRATFVSDAEGWAIFRDGSAIAHVPADETSDGFICSTDQSTGATWYFDAPAAWLGDQSQLYGGSLIFRLRQGNATSQYDDDDVLLEGAGLTLAYNTAINPFTEWTSYNVPLNETGWVDSTSGNPVTAEQMQAVLADLTALRIRGEYRNGSDTGCMDSVQINRGVQTRSAYRPRVEGQNVALDLPQFTDGGVFETVEGSIDQPGEVDTYTFELDAGRVVYFDSLNGSSEIIWRASAPDGSDLFGFSWSREQDDPGRFLIEQAGTYTVEFEGRGETTGPYSFQLWNVPSTQTTPVNVIPFDAATAETDPDATRGTLNFPGEEAAFTFDAQAGQIIYVDTVLGSSEIIMEIFNPDGSLLDGNNWTREQDDPGRFELAQSGTYIVNFDGRGPSIGEFAFQLYTVAPTITSAVDVIPYDATTAETDPDATRGAITMPGEEVSYTFDAQSGQIVYVDTVLGSSEIIMEIFNPDGSLLDGNNWTRERDDPGRFELDQSGTYTIDFDGRGATTGEFAFQLYTVAPTITSAIDVIPYDATTAETDPDATRGAITMPGEEVSYTFDAQAGQIVYVDTVLGSSDIIMEIFNPDGSLLDGNNWTRERDDPGRFDLDQSGTYTVTIDGRGATTGAFAFQVFTVAPTIPEQITLVTFDPATAEQAPDATRGEITMPGQEFVFTFEAAADQIVYVDTVEGSSEIFMHVLGPDGTELVSNSWTRSQDNPERLELNQTGTYTVTIDGRGGATGPFAFQILNVPPNAEFGVSFGTTIAPNTPGPGAGVIGVPGEFDVYTFQGSAGQSIDIVPLQGTSDIVWTLISPSEETIENQNWTTPNSIREGIELPETGEYFLIVEGRRDGFGEYSISIIETP